MKKKIIIKETENLRNTKLSNQSSIVTDRCKQVSDQRKIICVYLRRGSKLFIVMAGKFLYV